MASTLLDDYLSANLPALSDSELDAQLTGRPVHTQAQVSTATTKPAGKLAPPAPTADLSPETEAALTRGLTAIEVAIEDAESVDISVKTASHGVKVLAPLLNAISRWIDPVKNQSSVESIMATVLTRVRRDSVLVAQAYGLSPSTTPPWLTSQISGQIMDLLVQAIDRNNGAVIREDDTGYLAPLINLANQTDGIGQSYYGAPASPSFQLVNALSLAAATVMAEYHVFNYFYADPAHAAQVITDYLHERVIQGSLDQMTERFNLNDNERAYLGSSLLSGAGKLLADAWSSQMSATLDLVKEMPLDLRREVVLTGYPLDAVMEEFEKTYQGLEISSVSAVRSLSPHREIQPQIQGQAYAQTMR